MSTAAACRSHANDATAALARVEGEVGLRSLVERFPDLSLAPGAKRTGTRVLRGWEALPVRTGRVLSQA